MDERQLAFEKLEPIRQTSQGGWPSSVRPIDDPSEEPRPDNSSTPEKAMEEPTRSTST